MSPESKDPLSLLKSVINQMLSRRGLVWLVASLILMTAVVLIFTYSRQDFNFTTRAETLKIGTLILMVLYSVIFFFSYIYHTKLKEEHSGYPTWRQDVQMAPRFISIWFLPLTSILLVVVSQIATISESQNEDITFQEFNERVRTFKQLVANMETISSTNNTTVPKEVVGQIMQSEKSGNKVISDQSTTDSEQDVQGSISMDQIQIIKKLRHQMVALQQFVYQEGARRGHNPRPSYAYLLAFVFSTSVVLLMIGTEMAYIAQSHHEGHRWLVIVTASLFVDFLSYFLLTNGLRAPLSNEPSVVPGLTNLFTFLLGLFSGVSSYYTITKARMADEVLGSPSRNLDSQT